MRVVVLLSASTPLWEEEETRVLSAISSSFQRAHVKRSQSGVTLRNLIFGLSMVQEVSVPGANARSSRFPYST